MLGGFSLGATFRPVGLAGTNPTSLSLTGYWRGSYTSSPWSGTASAGSSSGRNLITQGVAPSPGSSLNGYTPVLFNSSNGEALKTSVTAENFISTSAYTVQLLVNPTTANAPSGNSYTDTNIIADSNSIWGIAYTTNGVTLYHYDTVAFAYKTVTVALSTGSWAVIDAVYDGANIKVRVNGGAWTSTAAGTLNTVTGDNLYVGVNASLASYFDGSVMELLIANTALSDATLLGTIAYFDSRYGLTL